MTIGLSPDRFTEYDRTKSSISWIEPNSPVEFNKSKSSDSYQKWNKNDLEEVHKEVPKTIDDMMNEIYAIQTDQSAKNAYFTSSGNFKFPVRDLRMEEMYAIKHMENIPI